MTKRAQESIILLFISLLFVGCLSGGQILPSTYEVSGLILDTEGDPIPEVNLIATPSSVTTKSRSDGSWEMSGLTGTVIITPDKEDYIFSPPQQEVKREGTITFQGSNNAESEAGTATVSFRSKGRTSRNSGSNIRPLVTMDDLHLFDRTMYIEPIASDTQGELVDSFTPSSFIVELFELAVNHPNYSMTLLPIQDIRTGESSGFSLPYHFDLVYADQIMDVSYIIEHEMYDFQQMQLFFHGRNRGDDSWTTFTGVSEVHVDLGPDYEGIDLINADNEKRYGTTHVFQLANLIPLHGDAPGVALFFDEHVDQPYIVNPDGSYVSDFCDTFWDVGSRLGTSFYCIYMPGKELDFYQGHNNLVFEWDLKDWIEIYDNGEPDDPSGHLVTLKLDNLFPIDFYVETIPEEKLPPKVTEPMDDVSLVEIRYFDLIKKEIAIRWLNPSNVDFKQAQIVRKIGEAPKDIEDGELVYTGILPLYIDADVLEHETYYYRIFAESYSGDISDGVITSIETVIPKVLWFSFTEGDDGLLELPLDSDVLIYVCPTCENNENLEIVVDWVINDPDIACLKGTKEKDRARGENIFIKGLSPGSTTITANYRDEIIRTIEIEVIE